MSLQYITPKTIYVKYVDQLFRQSNAEQDEVEHYGDIVCITVLVC